MRRILGSVGLVVVAGMFVAATNVHNGATTDDGKSIFLANKCNSCHSIDALGIHRTIEPKAGERIPSDLSGTGLKHGAEWFEKWLKKEVELDGAKHLKKFKGSDGDLDILTNWLATMKTKAKK